MEFVSNLIHYSDFFGFLITFVIPILVINAIIFLTRVLNNFNKRITKIEETILEFNNDIAQAYRQINNLEDFMMDYRQKYSHSYY
jgi:F0F1-type ATP synthase membrane subunit b/b'